MDLENALEVALDAAREARSITLRYFGGEKIVTRKPDSSPVTQADREAEAAIVDTIRKAFPDHGFLAEESGASDGTGGGAGPRWIIDPIDGTRGYIRGIPFWGTLIGLENQGRRVLGVLDLPALGETYFAVRGMGAFCGGERLHVSTTSDITASTLLLGEIPLAMRSAYGPSTTQLVSRFNLVRCYGDCYAPTFLLRGLAEVWIEPEIKAWDVAAIEVLVEEAGGRFTSMAGESTCHGTSALATNGILHPQVLAALSPAKAGGA